MRRYVLRALLVLSVVGLVVGACVVKTKPGRHGHAVTHEKHRKHNKHEKYNKHKKHKKHKHQKRKHRDHR